MKVLKRLKKSFKKDSQKSLTGSYYQSIDDCSLFIFRIVTLTGDLHHLLKSGKFSIVDAQNVWLKLNDEFNEAVNKNNNSKIEKRKQAYILLNEKNLLTNCLFMVTELSKANVINENKNFDINPYVKIINKYGYRFDLSKDLLKEIERVGKALKNYDSRAKSAFEAIKKDSNNGRNWTIENAIAELEKYLGFQINEEKTSVKRFVVYLNLMIEASKNGKQHKHKSNNGRRIGA